MRHESMQCNWEDIYSYCHVTEERSVAGNANSMYTVCRNGSATQVMSGHA